MNFEASVKRLNEIIALLQDPDVSLEESIKLYSEGTKLLKQCGDILKDAELKLGGSEAK